MTCQPVAWPVTVVATVDSTNEEAKRRARAGNLSPIWLRADVQTAGRGRQGRAWASPAGNLHATALFTLDAGYRQALRVPFAAAVAVAETVERLAPGISPRLKWPNDVRVDGAKLSGILVESGTTAGRFWVVAGIGMNVAFVPEGAGQAATSLADLRGNGLVDAAMAMSVLSERFAAQVAAIADDFAPIRSAWLHYAEGVGGVVRVRSGQGETYREGVFEDMAADGGLILRLPDGSRQTITAGDVELVRKD